LLNLKLLDKSRIVEIWDASITTRGGGTHRCLLCSAGAQNSGPSSWPIAYPSISDNMTILFRTTPFAHSNSTTTTIRRWTPDFVLQQPREKTCCRFHRIYTCENSFRIRKYLHWKRPRHSIKERASIMFALDREWVREKLERGSHGLWVVQLPFLLKKPLLRSNRSLYDGLPNTSGFLSLQMVCHNVLCLSFHRGFNDNYIIGRNSSSPSLSSRKVSSW